MIAKNARILSIVSCQKSHDHGAVSVLWTWEAADPFALTLHPEGTDQFWQLDRLDFRQKLQDVTPYAPLVSGIVSLKLRQINPFALSLRLSEYTPEGEKHAWLICSAPDVASFLTQLDYLAPSSYDDCGVDETLAKILTS